MLCVEVIVVKATVVIVQFYCVVYVVYWVYSNIRYNAKKFFCVCGVYFGYSKSRYCAMVLCCVCSLLWLQQQ